MALSLGIHEGSRITVGDHLIEVKEILRGKVIRVQAGGKSHLITDQQRTEVIPDVFLSYGSPTNRLSEFKGARLAVDAPQSMRILRVGHVHR